MTHNFKCELVCGVNHSRPLRVGILLIHVSCWLMLPDKVHRQSWSQKFVLTFIINDLTSIIIAIQSGLKSLSNQIGILDFKLFLSNLIYYTFFMNSLPFSYPLESKINFRQWSVLASVCWCVCLSKCLSVC